MGNDRPKLLGLYCKAGGASVGYYRAGFDVVGVDIEPQPRYPFPFVQGDAIQYLEEHGAEFAAFHASPPCQRYSEATPMEYRSNHPDLIAPTRAALLKTGKPFVIENVESARNRLINPVMLCGSSLGLLIERHRYFEINPSMFILTKPCQHRRGAIVEAEINGNTHRVQVPVLCTGGGDGKRASRKNHRPRGKVEEIRWAMEIDWMVQSELTEAIPPAYTEFIGHYLLSVLPANKVLQPTADHASLNS